ncbi:hypothetical protein CAPTEDRAFT_201337 [Capitella teleta]|uniref:Apple domain-containing protein n=1 Tax=Capitella teleta TaxID=283909 RepID=R7V5X1_CAPTE|nr:hypothetical protein CAPTEDRAFT_201337 [Capitella teleta]|eukprot:ELU13877.1 hypothetical protein CAPTEDRAFT_201337 [Capitella teleta]
MNICVFACKEGFIASSEEYGDEKHTKKHMCLLTWDSSTGAVSTLEAGCRWADGVPEYSIPERNNKKITGKVTEDQCKAACEGETDFTCRSIDYAEGLCYLSEDDTYTAKITRGNVQFTYFEIVCEKDPRNKDECPFVKIPGTYLPGRNLFFMKNVSPEDCIARCKSETTFHCRTIDYHRANRNCNLAIADRNDVVLTVHAGLDHYERTCDRAVSTLEAGCRWADGVPEYSIPERNNKKITGKVTEDQCKAACEGETDFTCRSIDYAEGLCYLSEDDTYTAKITRGNVQFTYFEIVCEKDPRNKDECPFVKIPGTYLPGRNLFFMKNVSPEDCIARCKSETTFHCRTIDYHRANRNCNLAIADRNDVVLTVHAGLDHYERTCDRKIF